jgi:hypothetical protein
MPTSGAVPLKKEAKTEEPLAKQRQQGGTSKTE